MYKFNGVGCSPCGGCKSMRGFGTDTAPPAHPDAEQDRMLIAEVMRYYTTLNVVVTSVVVLAGMYFIEEYWGRH